MLQLDTSSRPKDYTSIQELTDNRSLIQAYIQSYITSTLHPSLTNIQVQVWLNA